MFNKALRFVNRLIKKSSVIKKTKYINIGSGSQIVPNFTGIDFGGNAEILLDISKNNLPFKNNTIKAAICVSAINYFTRERGQQIISEVYRVLEPGGIARFSVQDLALIAKKYVNQDRNFFFQKLPNGMERFEGVTLGDKFASWFYGYKISGNACHYFYDYESLAYLFKKAGFSVVERRDYLDSRLDNIDLIDNRPEQMFFLEAIK